MKKLFFITCLLSICFIACEDEEFPSSDNYYEPQVEGYDINGLDCPDIKTVPLKGHTIEVPYFDPLLTCGDIPYPRGFKDVGGNLTHLGNVEGGFLEFFDCTPDMVSETVFTAGFTGEFVAANGDKVFYEGTLTFDVTLPGQGTSNSIITGGTGRWKNAKGCFRYYDVTPLPDGTIKVYVDGKISLPGHR